ncbi:hypothetical protein CEQ90_03915 [Lewinellaceae bacterium SD302]|nr:hypothetical protein CEQ90_03915 [Lewinellaceae bacterium SD302]
MRNEVKVGILVIVAVALSFWGYKFIQGKNLLSGANTYYALYGAVDGLSVGSPLRISGVNIGSVSSIELDQQTRLVKVIMEVNEGYNIPPNSIAYIASDGLLGGMKIDVVYDKPCLADGSDCLKSGSQIEGRERGMLSSFLGTDPENPTEDLTRSLDSVAGNLNDKFFGEDSDHPIARSSQDLATTMKNLAATTAQLQNLMATNNRFITSTMRNLSELTNGLAERQEALGGIIDNTEQFTGTLSEIEVQQTLDQVNAALKSLSNTLEQADGAVGGFNGIVANLNDGKGTIGKLLNDEEIYLRLDNASRSIDTLVTDLQERPYRYIPFKSRRRVLKFDRKDEENRADEVSVIDDK